MIKIFEELKNISGIATAHGQGIKQVFLNNGDSSSSLTQFAYGTFKPGEICEMHTHQTMEECFYFLKGEGIYIVGDKKFTLGPGSFLRIPAGILHELQATGSGTLEFVYFGIATDEK